MQSSRQVQQNFSTGWDTHNSSPLPHPSNRATCWSTTEYKRMGEDKAKQSVFGCCSSQDARNVKCFPRKFLHLQEEREGNQENFWHILGRESEHDSKESRDADWSTARKSMWTAQWSMKPKDISKTIHAYSLKKVPQNWMHERTQLPYFTSVSISWLSVSTSISICLISLRKIILAYFWLSIFENAPNPNVLTFKLFFIPLM